VRSIDTAKPRPLDENKVAAALSDANARRILSVCIKQARSVREIETETAMPQATVYRHVNHLVEEGLLLVERSAITPDGKRYELYRSRLRRARVEVDAAGVRVYWEPVEEIEERLARIWTSLRGI
jgi:DNA-binding IclR family transcriptional regulator